jgi:hypothetical protein
MLMQEYYFPDFVSPYRDTVKTGEVARLITKSDRSHIIYNFSVAVPVISGSQVTSEHRTQAGGLVNTVLVHVILAAALLAGCTTTSGVMEAEDGTYLISARAAPIRGGTVGANSVAYKDAQTFCATSGQ